MTTRSSVIAIPGAIEDSSWAGSDGRAAGAGLVRGRAGSGRKPGPAAGSRPATGAVLLLGLLSLGLAACTPGAGAASPPASEPSAGDPSVDASPAPEASPSASAAPSLPAAELPSAVPGPEESVPIPARPGPGSDPAEPGGGPVGGGTDLVIDVTDASGAVTTYTLSCDPPGGSHPDPTAACAALAEAASAAGGDPFRPTPPDAICTQEFGGPETASISGTLESRPVRASLSLRNGCEIDRWTRLGAVLSPFADVTGGGVTS